MKARNWKNWSAGMKIDGVANTIVLVAGVVVLLYAVFPADETTALPQRNAQVEQSGTRTG